MELSTIVNNYSLIKGQNSVIQNNLFKMCQLIKELTLKAAHLNNKVYVANSNVPIFLQIGGYTCTCTHAHLRF